MDKTEVCQPATKKTSKNNTKHSRRGERRNAGRCLMGQMGRSISALARPHTTERRFAEAGSGLPDIHTRLAGKRLRLSQGWPVQKSPNPLPESQKSKGGGKELVLG